MRTSAATMMLMGTVMIAQAVSASSFSRDAMRPSPRPVSPFALIGYTHDVRALSTVQSVRIEQLPVGEPRYGRASVRILVEPFAMDDSTHVAQLSMNGEPMSERRIAPGSSVILEESMKADGEVQQFCVTVQRLGKGGEPVRVARRCYSVVVPPAQF